MLHIFHCFIVTSYNYYVNLGGGLPVKGKELAGSDCALIGSSCLSVDVLIKT